MHKLILSYSLLSFNLLLIIFNTQAQDIRYARQAVDTLCSEAFLGRGYVQGGDRRAADYIAQEFRKFGLESYHENYQQKFQLSVNTLPGTLKLKVNGNTLTAGEDYLVDPASPSVSGSFKVIQLEVREMLEESALINKLKAAKDKFLLIDMQQAESLDKAEKESFQQLLQTIKYHPAIESAGTLLLTDQKLTWHASSLQHARPVVTVRKERISEAVEKLKLQIESRYYEHYQTQNVVAYLPGKSDSMLLFTAHYDHLGMMGKQAMFPGANDNASGVALLLDLAREYAAQEERPYTMVFIAFSGEELGLLGSQYFTENPPFQLEKIKFLLNMDISGTGDEGIQVVNGSVFRKEFELLKNINEENQYLPQVKIRGEACNSDHCLFYRKGVPCFFIYTLGGIKAYHDINDKAETLPLTEYEDYFKLLKEFVERLGEN
jgi:aminopeptidase YwaD